MPKEILRCPKCGAIMNYIRIESHYYCIPCGKEYTKDLQEVSPYGTPRRRKKKWRCPLCGKNPAGKKYPIKRMKICENCYYELLVLTLERAVRKEGTP